jgi:hypothetical protein
VGIALGIVGIIIALVALAIAVGVSLGRQGDLETAAHFQSELNELLDQMLDRLEALEKQHPKPGDEALPDASG